jgi:hypothetical protein
VLDGYSRGHKRCVEQTSSRLLCGEPYHDGQNMVVFRVWRVTDSGTRERPKSRVSMPTAIRLSLIPQRCAIRNHSCFDKSGQSVGNSLRRDSGSCSMAPSASLSDKACRRRITWGEDSPSDVDDDNAAPRKSQRTCRRVQLMLQKRISINEDHDPWSMTHTIAAWTHRI